jgi:hypothetical protein
MNNNQEVLAIANLPAHKLDNVVMARLLELANEDLVRVGRKPELDYKSAVLSLMSQNSAKVMRVNPALIDQDIIANMSNTFIPWLIRKKGAVAYQLVGQERIARCLDADINAIKDIDRAYVSDELLKEVIKGQPKRMAHVVEAVGRRNVIDELIVEGFWPHRESNVPTKPASLDEAVKKRMSKSWDDNEAMWLNALIRSYPQQEVFPMMKTASRRKIFMEIYDRDILLREFSHDKKLMGLLIESEMGL